MTCALRSLVLLSALASCSAPALQSDLAAAERYEKAGRDEPALRAYRRAQKNCKNMRNTRLRRDTCAQSHIGYAELLETLGRNREAAEAYEAIPRQLEERPIPSAKAIYRAGRLWLKLGEDKRGYTLLWKTVTDYPDVVYATDALRVVYFDGRRRNIAQLYRVLSDLVDPLAGNEVSDNIHYYLAQLAENDFARPKIALAHYDDIVAKYRDGGLYDDSLWNGARLARKIGDPRGAVERLRTLLATREVSFGVGSYFSVWLDNAQLEVGRVLRDDLKNNKAALRAFRRLPRDYPASILRDDATFESAVTWERLGNTERACRALTRLQEKWPESKYELERGPAMRRKLGCPAR